MTTTTTQFDPITLENVHQWLNGHYDADAKAEIRQLMQNNPKEILDAFYTTLSFGTGGLRGIMGVGTNRMNQYTVRAATQGLANYINGQPVIPNKKHAVVIGYDSRDNSQYFAEEAAKVLAGNEIEVYLFKELRPVGLVSFGCLFKKCSAGIMITASHNPPIYNGYKVYWNDGGQVLPPHDKGIIDEVKRIHDNSMVKSTLLTHPLIHLVTEEFDSAYLKAIEALQLYPNDNKQQGHTLKVVYSNLHGTGITMIPRTLKNRGFTALVDVDQQKIPDGKFPTVVSPNPEERQALELGIETMLSSQSDLLLATDPDADRVGVAVSHHGKAVLLNGNEIASLCLEHICKALKDQNRMPAKAAFIKTIVTTELFKAIAESYGKPCFDVLTGFKYIAELIRKWETQQEGYDYIFGGEESYGCLHGTETRDKDAVSTSALICEVALQAKMQNKDLVDLLYDLYTKYGIYKEKLVSVNFEESKTGKELMDKAMAELRQNPPKSICGIDVSIVEDYQTSIRSFMNTKNKEQLTLPMSNVLLFWLKDGSKVVVRPSGTEPKIKLYCGVSKKISKSIDVADLEKAIAGTDKYADSLLQEMKSVLLK